jgi:hypothetical protein
MYKEDSKGRDEQQQQEEEELVTTRGMAADRNKLE